MYFSYLNTQNTSYQDYFSNFITNNKTVEPGKAKDCSNAYAMLVMGRGNSAQNLVFSRSSTQLCMIRPMYTAGLVNQKNPQAADTSQLLVNRKQQIAAQTSFVCLFVLQVLLLEYRLLSLTNHRRNINRKHISISTAFLSA